MDVIEIGSTTPGAILAKLKLANPQEMIAAAMLQDGSIQIHISLPADMGHLLLMKRLISAELDKKIFGSMRQEAR